ncbi:hypothetical protein G9A89_006799 [Geosiphon pyriformis]|nr:hypothetical protein G9A89_006799 [Geosiphon pyriformis]
MFIENGGLVDSSAVDCHSALSEFLYDFGFVNDYFVQSESGIIDIYTDNSVKGLGSVGACGGATAYFLCINLSISVRVYGLLFLILAELQAIALALNCIPALSFVILHTDSQAFLDMCAFLNCSVDSNFHKKCWIEKEHICFTVTSKNLSVSWVKVKSHSKIVSNVCADFFADAATDSKFVLPISVMHHFFAVKDSPTLSAAYYKKEKIVQVKLS